MRRMLEHVNTDRKIKEAKEAADTKAADTKATKQRSTPSMVITTLKNYTKK